MFDDVKDGVRWYQRKPTYRGSTGGRIVIGVDYNQRLCCYDNFMCAFDICDDSCVDDSYNR